MTVIVCYDPDAAHSRALQAQISGMNLKDTVCVRSFERLEEMDAYMNRHGDVTDVLLYDIGAGPSSTMSVVGRIKRAYSNIQIIFMSDAQEWCDELYAVEHVYFLKKPVASAALFAALEVALRISRRLKERCLSIQSQGEYCTVPFSGILYVQAFLREVLVVTRSDRFTSYNRISDVERVLDSRFLRCHKSYIVNLDRVTAQGSLRFVVENGGIVPVSRARSPEARRRLGYYRGELNA